MQRQSAGAQRSTDLEVGSLWELERSPGIKDEAIELQRWQHGVSSSPPIKIHTAPIERLSSRCSVQTKAGEWRLLRLPIGRLFFWFFCKFTQTSHLHSSFSPSMMPDKMLWPRVSTCPQRSMETMIDVSSDISQLITSYPIDSPQPDIRHCCFPANGFCPPLSFFSPIFLSQGSGFDRKSSTDDFGPLLPFSPPPQKKNL